MTQAQREAATVLKFAHQGNDQAKGAAQLRLQHIAVPSLPFFGFTPTILECRHASHRIGGHAGCLALGVLRARHREAFPLAFGVPLLATYLIDVAGQGVAVALRIKGIATTGL